MFNWPLEELMERNNGSFVEENFNYSSGTNEEWLSVEEIQDLVEKNKNYFNG